MLIIGALALLLVLAIYGIVWSLLLAVLWKLERIRLREEMTHLGVAALYFMRFVVLAMAFLPPMEFVAMTVSRGDPWPPEGWDSARLSQHCTVEFMVAIAVAVGFAAIICGVVYLLGRRRAARTARSGPAAESRGA